MVSEFDASVIVPTHNRARLLRRVINALAAQRYPADRFEVIVVDDGSGDGTAELLQDIAAPFALVVLSQRQGGAAQARNSGAARARSGVLAFLDDDILPDPGWLGEHLRYHAQDGLAVVIGRLVASPERRPLGWCAWEDRLLEQHFAALANGRRAVQGRHVYSGNFSVRKEDFERAGRFDETMPRAEDIDLGYRLAALGLHCYFNPAAAGVHCGHQSYRAWMRICYEYGRRDVIMARDKGYPGILSEILERFDARSMLTRGLVHLMAGHAVASRLLLGLLNGARLMAGLPRASAFEGYPYSAISNLCYWQGVIDELGGGAIFWSSVRQHRLRRVSVDASPAPTSRS